MRLSSLIWIGLSAALAAAIATSSCGGVSGKPCTAGTTQCVGSDVERICASDNTWVSQTCGSGQVCMGSACASANDMACNNVNNTCTDSTHALVCNSNGVGFKSVACPTGTTCQGLGLCVGTCVVGASNCNGFDRVETCTDGFTFTETACTWGMTACVNTNDGNAPGVIAAAACMPEGCNPTTNSTCGDKAADPTNTDPRYVSDCAQSPSGYHWESVQCFGASTCSQSPGGASCQNACTPGDIRCNGNGVQTCDANGQWQAPVACTPTATGQQQVCLNTYNGTPGCGDPVCAGAPGACESDGFHPCVNGKVSPTGEACPIGVCVGAANTVGGYTPGSCQAQCQYTTDATNPSRCDGGTAYQTCTANDRWTVTATACPTGTSCQQWNDANGESHTVCGQCVPGQHRCTDGAGTVVGNGPDIEVCDSTGNWGAYTACSVGQCQFAGGDYACTAQCVPGSTVCVGPPPATAPNPEHPGTANWGTCDANGNLPVTGTACATGSSCRKGVNGQPVGTGAAACVQCVGGNIPGGNENGLVDSYCTATASPGSLELCTASNTWGTSNTCSTTPPANGTCTQETNQQDYCYNYNTYNGHNLCTASGINAYFGVTTGCSYWWGTGSESWGGTPDCCASYYCPRANIIPWQPAVCD